MPFDLPPALIPSKCGTTVEKVYPTRMANNDSFTSNPFHLAKMIIPHAVDIRYRQKVSTRKPSHSKARFAADRVPLESIKIESNWKQTHGFAKWAFGGNSGYDYEFIRKSSKASAVLSLYWDGRFVEPMHRAGWREMLTKQPHKLAGEEIQFLYEALYLSQGNQKQFRLNSAQTVVWNGRTVVETEGQTIEADQPVYKRHEIAFDNYGDYSTAGTISYSAKLDDFAKFESGGLKMMKSIKWTKLDRQ